MTIEAKVYESSSVTYTKSLHQHDKNITLLFSGIEMPQKYEVHFSNQKDHGLSINREGTGPSILIPNELLTTGEYIYAWVCLPDNEGAATLFNVVIPVIPKPIPIVSFPSGAGMIRYTVNEEEEDVHIL